MSHKTPNDLQAKVLLEIWQGLNHNSVLPRTQDLAIKLNVVEGSISTAKKKLREIGYLDNNSSPTSFGIDFIKARRYPVLLQVPFMGKVKAGRVGSDEIVVDMSDIGQLSSVETITIPNIQSTQPLIMLKVDGVSMIEERIYPNDYILVSVFEENNAPNQGDLVVAKYVPVRTTWDMSQDFQISDDAFEGPTLKYYYQEHNYYRLSTQKNHRQSPYTIEASIVRAIGKVVGVYHSVNQ